MVKKKKKKGFANNSKTPSWAERIWNALSPKGETSYILPKKKRHSWFGVVKYVNCDAFAKYLKVQF